MYLLMSNTESCDEDDEEVGVGVVEELVDKPGRTGTGAVVKNRKGLSGVEGGKGTCYQWKEKSQCSKGDLCSFRHERIDCVQKPDHNAATPSEPSFSRGRCVSRKKYPSSTTV